MIVHKFFLILGLLLLSLSLSNLAKADFARGLEAYNQGDYETALKEWLIDANQGNASAQALLGIMYANGDGVPKNFILGYMWTNLAAAQGNEGAKENKEVFKGWMTADQIAEAQRLSTVWLDEHQ